MKPEKVLHGPRARRAPPKQVQCKAGFAGKCHICLLLKTSAALPLWQVSDPARGCTGLF
jgi:hypothetical protein